MSYIRPARTNSGTLLTAQQWNQFIVENFTVGLPGQIAAKGDLIVGSGADSAARLAALSGAYYRRRGLRVNASGAIEWEVPVYWRWSGIAPYEIAGSGAHNPIPMQNVGNLGGAPVAEGNSYYFPLPEGGAYEFAVSVLMLVGIGGCTANQVAQAYVGVNDADYEIARWTVPVTTGAHSYNLMNGVLVLPNLLAGQRIRFRLRNEMHVRLASTYGCLRRVR